MGSFRRATCAVHLIPARYKPGRKQMYHILRESKSLLSQCIFSQCRVEFQRRKSSYSSIESSTLNLQECIDIEEPVFSINTANQPTLPEGMYSIILDLIWISDWNSWWILEDFFGNLLFPTWLKQNFFITEIHTHHTSDSDSDSSSSNSSYDISEGTVYISGQ